MRPRLLAISTLCLLSLIVCAGAGAYPWPVRPFGKQHPIRANFGDPRTRFWNTMLTDGLQGPGFFQFHNGIDISAPAETPVFPVVSGVATVLSNDAVSVRTKDNRTFQYFHITPGISSGVHIFARRTVLGYVLKAYEHVHLSEIRARRFKLKPDGIEFLPLGQ